MDMLQISEIDAFLKRLDHAKNDTEMREIFTTYQAQFELDLPPDPFSEEYRAHQFAIYKMLADKPYAPSNEISLFDVDAAAVRPFPYMNGSCELVGNHLMAIGFLIKSLNLNAGARILEFGPGWGNTTIALAKMGFHVTAVDIEQNFIDLINKRAAMERLDITAKLGDFSLIENVDEPYDAVLFFECFHHASDHLALIAAFEKAVKPGGFVCLAAEPIVADFPIPWGLRMDGESIWAIRKNGWLELGFNEKYFRSALEKFGWRGTTLRGNDSPASAVIIAKRLADWGGVYRFNGNGLLNRVGQLSAQGCTADGREGYLAYGPYITLPAGAYRAKLMFGSGTPLFGGIKVDVAVNGGTQILSEKTMRLNEFLTRKMSFIDFEADFEMQNVEVRVLCAANAQLCLEAIRILGV
jgi:ubiquinone/menaquinone biosynthesis C-methylase UbiE